MRLTVDHIDMICRVVAEEAGDTAEVRLFGSRLDDQAKGGDVDLLVESSTPVEQPAYLAARISARLTRCMQGRKVDIVLAAPNLERHEIHDIAKAQGARL